MNFLNQIVCIGFIEKLLYIYTSVLSNLVMSIRFLDLFFIIYRENIIADTISTKSSSFKQSFYRSLCSEVFSLDE